MAPAFVDAHTHALSVAAKQERHGYGQSIRQFHEKLFSEGLSPTDIPHTHSETDLLTAFSRLFSRYSDINIVEMHEMGCWEPDYWPVLVKMRELDRVPIRVVVFLTYGVAKDFLPGKTGDSILEFGGVKFYADGYLGAQTAALEDEYANEPGNRGLLFDDATSLARKMQPFADKGLTLATHAIGDRAIGATLDAYDMVYGSDVVNQKPRIEHAQVINNQLVERIKNMAVRVCIQPCFAETDHEMAIAALGNDRMKSAYDWNLLVDAGVEILTGSDFEIETDDPLIGLEKLSKIVGEPTALALMSRND